MATVAASLAGSQEWCCEPSAAFLRKQLSESEIAKLNLWFIN